MTQALALLAAAFAVVFLVISFQRRADVRTSLRELWPLALALTFTLVALLIENSDEGSFSIAEFVLIVSGLALLIGSVALYVAEGRRMARSDDDAGPSRLQTSRGLWGIGGGALTLALAIALPVLAARVALPGQIADLPTPTPGPTQTMNEVARGVYDRVLQAVSDETGYDVDTISARLDAGEASVAAMVRETDGDVEAVVRAITTIMNDQVRVLAADGRMDEGQAAFAISAMEAVVRAGVEFDLQGLMARFEES